LQHHKCNFQFGTLYARLPRQHSPLPAHVHAADQEYTSYEANAQARQIINRSITLSIDS